VIFVFEARIAVIFLLAARGGIVRWKHSINNIAPT
jgi:hypothetical protein